MTHKIHHTRLRTDSVILVSNHQSKGSEPSTLQVQPNSMLRFIIYIKSLRVDYFSGGNYAF